VEYRGKLLSVANVSKEVRYVLSIHEHNDWITLSIFPEGEIYERWHEKRDLKYQLVVKIDGFGAKDPEYVC
jgi:hypothetical protein